MCWGGAFFYAACGKWALRGLSSSRWPQAGLSLLSHWRETTNRWHQLRESKVRENAQFRGTIKVSEQCTNFGVCRKSFLLTNCLSFLVWYAASSDSLVRDPCSGSVIARITTHSSEGKRGEDCSLLPLTWHISCADRMRGEALRVCEGKSSARRLKTIYVAAPVISQAYSKEKEKENREE